MKLNDIINKSWYGSIGYIENQESIDILGSYLLHNKPVLDEYKGHIFAFTYEVFTYDILEKTIHSLFPNAKIILLDKNRGHNFGTADLDNTIFDYDEIQNIPNYNGKIWEYFQGWTCERFLKKCIERNNLSKYHLVSQKTYIKLLELIKRQQIHDCSHKNIMIEGICHYQNQNQKIKLL